MSVDKIVAKISHASFSYENHPVFEDVSFEVKKGEILCLMGRNGCGKSTLLDSVLGIHPLKKGEILIDGRAVSSYKAQHLARKMAYVPQVHDRSFPYKTRQIVLMGRTAYAGEFGAPDEEDKKIVKRIMEEVGISYLADRPYTQISGGEMQMVILARALAQESPFILMDEPTAHLDFSNEMLFLEILAKFIGQENKTVLMATHSPNQAFYLDALGINVRVALMKDGSLTAIGKPRDMLTEEMIRHVYQIEGKILTDGIYRQIMPVRTSRGERNETK